MATDIASQFRADGFVAPLRALSPSEAGGFLAHFRDYRDRLAGHEFLSSAGLVFKPHLLSRWGAALVRHPAILDAVECILGPDLLVWSADLFIRPPVAQVAAGAEATAGVAPRGLLWHQDAPNHSLRPLDHIVRAWVALTPTTPANGTVRYLPGSHRHGVLPHAPVAGTDAAVEGERVRLDLDEEEAVPVVLEPGQFSLHDMRTVHGSGENRTREERVAVSITYVSPDVDPGGDDCATLVRGGDTHGHYRLEPTPRADLSPGAITAFLRAVRLRMDRFEAAGAPDGHRQS